MQSRQEILVTAGGLIGGSMVGASIVRAVKEVRGRKRQQVAIVKVTSAVKQLDELIATYAECIAQGDWQGAEAAAWKASIAAPYAKGAS